MTSYPGENPAGPQDDRPDGSADDAGADNAPDAGPADGAADDTEPTQPVGYWERLAAEQAREQGQQGHPGPYASPSGAVFNPTSAQPSSGSEPGSTRPYEQSPYGQQPPQGQPPQGQPTYGQPPYGQPPYGQPPYGQAPYGQAPGQPSYGHPPYGQPSYGQPPPGGQSGPPSGGPTYPPYAAFTPPRPDHPQATLSLILGIVGLVGGFMCGLGLVLSPFAWALGRNAVKEIRASQGRLGGESTARAGMITGIVGSVFLALAILALIGFAVLVAVSETTTGSNV